MNKIEHYILQCGNCIDEMVAYNTVTIRVISNDASLDDDTIKNCLRERLSNISLTYHDALDHLLPFSESGDNVAKYKNVYDVVRTFSMCGLFVIYVETT